MEDLLKEVEKLLGPQTATSNSTASVSNTTTTSSQATIPSQPARFSVFDTLAQA